ncbi:MAG: winged helix DNA-binding domain-containing protein [Planctomycetes bacterium]|nr:winged helix DNA-binding domain-containing protein [Planctomycetota bacterium]
MPRSAATPEVISAADARRVLLHLQGLAEPPARSSAKSVQDTVERLGYVQLDSINVLERAHHMILGTRLEGYRHEHLSHAVEKTRALWEHWTHDACVIPTKWFPHWKHRFIRYKERVPRSAWWRSQIGNDSDRTIRRTLARVRREGPLRARDFEPPEDHRSEGWWEWHPEKAALEYLWRSGRLAIARRERFEKVYDLVERVLPGEHMGPRSSESKHVEWACREAIDRLGIANPSEISRFFNAITPAQARKWCAAAIRRGDLVEVAVTPERGGKPVSGVALPNWKSLRRTPQRDRILLLSPFDPVVRERSRVERLFDFDYRFEAFTPAAKRKYGYYVLPMLEGDQLIGRIDPKFDRASGTLVVRGPWWSPGFKSDAARNRRFGDALDRLAAQIGASRWTMEQASKNAH